MITVPCHCNERAHTTEADYRTDYRGQVQPHADAASTSQSRRPYHGTRIIPAAVHVHWPEGRDDTDHLQQQSEQRASSAMRSLAEAEGCARCAIKTCSHGSLGNCASHDHEGVMTDSGLRAIGMQEV